MGNILNWCNVPHKRTKSPYCVIKYVPYEIRIYNACIVAETSVPNLEIGFRKLEKFREELAQSDEDIGEYIAASDPKEALLPVSKPRENEQLNISSSVLAFVLPVQHQHYHDVPFPSDPDVQIKPLPVRIVAVLRYRGKLNSSGPQRRFEKLRKMLVTDGVIVEPETLASDDTQNSADTQVEKIRRERDEFIQNSPPYLMTPYQVPFKCCRRIEVCINLDPTNPRVAEMLRSHENPTYGVRTAMDRLMESNYFEDPLDAEYGSENEEVNQELEVPTSLHVKRRTRKIVSSAEKFLSGGGS